MDVLTDLSIQIAEATVPDEIDLAPLMTEAFIRGGKEKESLFVKQKSAGLGAFGLGGDRPLFPLILKGIAVTAPLILQILSPGIDYLGGIYHLMGIYHLLGVPDKLETKDRVNQLPEKYSKAISSLFEAFLSELRSSELPDEQCNRIIANVLVTLLKDPSISRVFVEKVAGVK